MGFQGPAGPEVSGFTFPVPPALPKGLQELGKRGLSRDLHPGTLGAMPPAFPIPALAGNEEK